MAIVFVLDDRQVDVSRSETKGVELLADFVGWRDSFRTENQSFFGLLDGRILRRVSALLTAPGDLLRILAISLMDIPLKNDLRNWQISVSSQYI